MATDPVYDDDKPHPLRSGARPVRVPRRPKVLSARYRLERVLGAGSSGHVHIATDLETRTRVAVKVLSATLADKPDARERFVREAQLLGAVSHPGVIEIRDVGFDEEVHPYFVMEYVPGRTLRDVLRRSGPLGLRRAAMLTCQLLAALEAVHRAGIVHRDVKPDNLIITAARPVERLKLVDFGLGRRLGRRSSTGQGVALGTPGYMSPEQILGEVVDARTDVYGAGSTLYRMVAGRTPIVPGDPKRPAQYFDRVLTTTPDPLRSLRPDAPAELEALVARAVSPDRATRFPSCDAMRIALSAMLPHLSNDPPSSERLAEDQDDIDTVEAFR